MENEIKPADDVKSVEIDIELASTMQPIQVLAAAAESLVE
jgi:hypothetical protein